MLETIRSTLFKEHTLFNPSQIAFKFTKSREKQIYLRQLLIVPQMLTENLPDTMFVQIKADSAKKIRRVTSQDLATTGLNLILEYTVPQIHRIE